MATMLDDKTIRKALIQFLERRKPKPKLVAEEVGVHNGNAIADVVSIHNRSLHGYEIKGESDSVSRIIRQSKYYNQSFPKLSLVTTPNHMDWAQKNLPEFWGIILVKKNSAGVGIVHKRPAKNNPFFSKEMSLLMLWKEELLSARLFDHNILTNERDSRAKMASKIADKLSKEEIINLLSASIINRKTSNTATKASRR